MSFPPNSSRSDSDAPPGDAGGTSPARFMLSPSGPDGLCDGIPRSGTEGAGAERREGAREGEWERGREDEREGDARRHSKRSGRRGVRWVNETEARGEHTGFGRRSNPGNKRKSVHAVCTDPHGTGERPMSRVAETP
ncbi:hypothetical protein GCM10010305_58190 [Streptomyces termitum]|uniref:Uncharacterized protein n=1 Tax=Streptomyces termitum TaxID=67368 RepID=A0A918T8R0_9ACTN|nr:hypothetical protein GCM10010305_58190 [Streptomyces termitum]